MFWIRVEDTGNQSGSVLNAIKKCLQPCFNKQPDNLEHTRESIAQRLSKPDVMGQLYRHIWVDQMGRNYFIIIATSLEDGMGRRKPILCWAIRRKMKDSLAELCLEVISKSLSEIEDINKLGLPTRLERDTEKVFRELSL